MKKIKIFLVSKVLLLILLSSVHEIVFADYDQCILNNMKNATNSRAADYVAEACRKKFNKKSERGKGKSANKVDPVVDPNDIGPFKFTLENDLTRPYTLNLAIVKRRDYEYDFQETKFEIMNKNTFGISKVLIGIPQSEDCGNDISDYSIVYECSIDLDYVIGPGSGGSINCGRQITEPVCVYGFVTEWLPSRKAFMERLNGR